MSVERPLEAWEEMQRHGQDLADRLAQGLTGLLQSHISPPPFSWPAQQKPKNLFHEPSGPADRRIAAPAAVGHSSINSGVSAIFDIGNKLGQAGAEFGACLTGVVQQFFRHLPVPFRQDEGGKPAGLIRADLENRRERNDAVERRGEDVGLAEEKFGNCGSLESVVGLGDLCEEDGFGFDLKSSGHFGRPQGSINFTSTYDSRTRDFESSLVARGDLWRAEASHGGSGSDNSPLFLIQLGPVLFVRDTTLLLPVHLSKQHLLWYGYDRKNGMHSLCPAIWSKHRRWLLMSMICLNPFACSFMDLQFPNGQLTYVTGEGLSTSAFLPAFGGLLQVQGQYPGETRFSFSCKNKWGTRITPMMQWPDKSFSLGVVQPLALRRSGLMLRPSIQFSICPTFGGSNPGLQTELIHCVKEKLSLILGCLCTSHPSAYASIALGRSKWNGHVGSYGMVLRMETPLSSVGRTSFSIQLNSGVEF
uniref:Ubiquitin carboxyl-terminal hydrolase 40 n=1 Tax=Anthurium amnicola TaxID=1678845 RepID=A0A1D1XYW9_9ARAE